MTIKITELLDTYLELTQTSTTDFFRENIKRFS